MAGDTIVTVVGNLTADPELRFTQAGNAVASLSIASTPRSFNRQTNEWEDGETLFLRGSIWRDAAEHVAESLTKGTRVVAQGRLVQRSFEDRDGNQRTVVELEIDEIGPSLRYATAQVTRAQSNQQGGQQRAQQDQGEPQGQQGAPRQQRSQGQQRPQRGGQGNGPRQQGRPAQQRQAPAQQGGFDVEQGYGDDEF